LSELVRTHFLQRLTGDEITKTITDSVAERGIHGSATRETESVYLRTHFAGGDMQMPQSGNTPAVGIHHIKEGPTEKSIQLR
jgi:hypothetical protein